MELSRLITFIIGLVLAAVGLFMIVGNPHDLMNLVIGLVLVVVGLVILSGKVLSL